MDGALVGAPGKPAYLALNKPAGVVTTARDPQGRTTVLDLVAVEERVFPVGRLDFDAQGLLLLTTDGDLAHRLTHPSFETPKTYVAEVEGKVSDQSLRKLRVEGVKIDRGRPARAIRARLLSVRGGRSPGSVVEITVHEGRKHVVKKMLEALGHPARSLTRTAFGPVRLGRLRPGTYRRLTHNEVSALLKEVGM